MFAQHLFLYIVIKKCRQGVFMGDALILIGVVLGFLSVVTLFGQLIENFGWVEEEKEKFDSEF